MRVTVMGGGILLAMACHCRASKSPSCVRYHNTRCQLVKQTYAIVMPPGHYIFYSDADDPSLPAVRVEETSFPRCGVKVVGWWRGEVNKRGTVVR